jgi:putative intracellular protease/amidase
MKEAICYLFVCNGFSDWEPALAIANLKKHFNFTIRSFSLDGKPIRTMGNLQIQPDCAMREVDATTTDLLLLPGGDVWEQGGNLEIAPLVKAISAAEKTIAAICGATVFMANNGYLDSIEHTSNALPYLQKLAPNYKGEKLYQNKPCVTSGHIITANGAAMIEFAIAIFNKFKVEEPDFIEKISALYKSGGMDYRF